MLRPGSHLLHRLDRRALFSQKQSMVLGVERVLLFAHFIAPICTYPLALPNCRADPPALRSRDGSGFRVSSFQSLGFRFRVLGLQSLGIRGQTFRNQNLRAFGAGFTFTGGTGGVFIAGAGCEPRRSTGLAGVGEGGGEGEGEGERGEGAAAGEDADGEGEGEGEGGGALSTSESVSTGAALPTACSEISLISEGLVSCSVS